MHTRVEQVFLSIITPSAMFLKCSYILQCNILELVTFRYIFLTR